MLYPTLQNAISTKKICSAYYASNLFWVRYQCTFSGVFLAGVIVSIFFHIPHGHRLFNCTVDNYVAIQQVIIALIKYLTGIHTD